MKRFLASNQTRGSGVPAAMVLLLSSVGTGAALGASFDCRLANTGVEHLICSDPQLSVLDEQMARVYAEATRRVRDAAAIRAEQRSWLTDERGRCADRACLLGRYRERIDVLGRLGSASNASKTSRIALQRSGNDGTIGPEDVIPAEIDDQILHCQQRGQDYQRCLEAAWTTVEKTVPDAAALSRAIGTGGWWSGKQWLRIVEDHGVVDYAQVEALGNYPIYESVLVNGTPSAVVAFPNKETNGAIQAHPQYSNLLHSYLIEHGGAPSLPNRLFPARFNQLIAVEENRMGGQRFVVRHALMACMGCDVGGWASVAYDFDGHGRYLGQWLMDVLPPVAADGGPVLGRAP